MPGGSKRSKNLTSIIALPLMAGESDGSLEVTSRRAEVSIEDLDSQFHYF